MNPLKFFDFFMSCGEGRTTCMRRFGISDAAPYPLPLTTMEEFDELEGWLATPANFKHFVSNAYLGGESFN